MVKKVLVGAFLALMVGAIIAGAIALFGQSADAHAYARTEAGEQGAVARRGANGQRGQAGDAQLDCEGPQGEGQGQGRGAGRGTEELQSGSSLGSPGQGGRGQGEQGQGQGQGRGQGLSVEPQAAKADWQEIEGLVVETAELVVQTASGDVQVGLGPSFYRDAAGFVLNVGDNVRVSGYWEDGELKAAQVENVDSGESIVLRDSSGRPMWAGQGRGKNQGA